MKLDRGVIEDYTRGIIDEDYFAMRIKLSIAQIETICGPGVEIMMEGIETKLIYDLMQKHFGGRIHSFQGFYFDRPSSINNLIIVK